jgi:hypothetical protein
MKSMIQIAVFTVLVIAAFNPALQAQTQSQHKDLVAESPSTDADIKVVIDYFNALLVGDLATVKSLMADNYMAYGPSATDSSNAQKELLAWAENYKTQTNRKIEFVSLYFKVEPEDFSANWVNLSGIYSCDIDGINIAIPVQITSLVENGKIKKQLISFDNLELVQDSGSMAKMSKNSP